MYSVKLINRPLRGCRSFLTQLTRRSLGLPGSTLVLLMHLAFQSHSGVVSALCSWKPHSPTGACLRKGKKGFAISILINWLYSENRFNLECTLKPFSGRKYIPPWDSNLKVMIRSQSTQIGCEYRWIEMCFLVCASRRSTFSEVVFFVWDNEWIPERGLQDNFEWLSNGALDIIPILKSIKYVEEIMPGSFTV